MANPETYYFQLPEGNRPPISVLDEQVHPDYVWLTNNRSRSRQRDVFKVVDTVVIHATAGYSTHDAVAAWHSNVASAHWIVPDENEPQHGSFAWACVAEAKAAYHVRDTVDVQQTVLGSGPNTNNRSLGIELVNTQDVENYNDPFSQWQVTMAARIVLYAWAKYPNLRHVISHAKLDPNRRGDPGRQFPWPTFKAAILDHSVLVAQAPLVFDLPESRHDQVVVGACLP